MSTLFVDADKLEAQSENINLCETAIKNVNITLHEIIDEIQLGESTVEIRNAIRTCCQELKIEAADLSMLIEQLDAIRKLYISTEYDLTGGTVKTDKPAEADNHEVTDSKETFDLDKWLAKQTGLSENAIEIIKFILGFIPVINCITDIYQLVDDVTQALSDDGKISGGEWLALGADVIFLGLDVVAAGDIIKAVKVAKVANTEAKAAKKVAEQAAKTAEKKAAKSAGSVPTTKAAQKATKAVKNAVRKAAQADEAKQIATGAAKDVIKKVTEGAANNVMDEYVATPGNAGMPNAVKRESRDNLILSY